MMLMLNLKKYTGNSDVFENIFGRNYTSRAWKWSNYFSDIKNNRIQTYTDQDLTFVVPKGGVECFGIETEQLEDIDQGYKNHSS